MKNIISTLIIILIVNISFSQRSFDHRIFNKICNELVTENNIHELKIKLSKNFKLLIDPNTDEFYIDTIKTMNYEIINKTKGIDKYKLIKILKQDSLPFIPLSKEIIFIDTIGFFNSDYVCKIHDYEFKVVKNEKAISKRKGAVRLTVYMTTIINNELVLSITTNVSKNHFYNIYFKYQNNILTLTHVKSIWQKKALTSPLYYEE